MSEIVGLSAIVNKICPQQNARKGVFQGILRTPIPGWVRLGMLCHFSLLTVAQRCLGRSSQKKRKTAAPSTSPRLAHPILYAALCGNRIRCRALDIVLDGVCMCLGCGPAWLCVPGLGQGTGPLDKSAVTEQSRLSQSKIFQKNLASLRRKWRKSARARGEGLFGVISYWRSQRTKWYAVLAIKALGLNPVRLGRIEVSRVVGQQSIAP